MVKKTVVVCLYLKRTFFSFSKSFFRIKIFQCSQFDPEAGISNALWSLLPQLNVGLPDPSPALQMLHPAGSLHNFHKDRYTFLQSTYQFNLQHTSTQRLKRYFMASPGSVNELSNMNQPYKILPAKHSIQDCWTTVLLCSNCSFLNTQNMTQFYFLTNGMLWNSVI